MSRPTRERKPVSYAEDPIEDSDLDERENVAQRMPSIKFAEQRNTRAAVPAQKKLLRCTANPGATKAEADLAAQALSRPARSTVATKSYRELDDEDTDGSAEGASSDDDFEAAVPKGAAASAHHGSSDEESAEVSEHSASEEAEDEEEAEAEQSPPRAQRTRGGADEEPLRRPARRGKVILEDSDAEEAAGAAPPSEEEEGVDEGADKGRAAKSQARRKLRAQQRDSRGDSSSDADSDEFQGPRDQPGGKQAAKAARPAPARQQPRRAAREVLPPDLKQFAFRDVSPPARKREAPPKRGAAAAAAGKLQQQRQQQQQRLASSPSGDENGSSGSDSDGNDGSGPEDEVVSVSGSDDEASGAEEDDEGAEAQETGAAGPAAFKAVIRQRNRLPGKIYRVLRLRYVEGGEMELSIKFHGLSHRKVAWVTHAVTSAVAPQQVRNFMQRAMQPDNDLEGMEFEDGVDPEWRKVDRVLAERRMRGKTQYLVKWCGLEYSDATWESEADLKLPGDEDAIETFHRVSTPPAKLTTPSRPTKTEVESKKLPVFLNGRALRSYQEESLRWMLNNYRGGQGRNLQWEPRACILGDEMGLGKTAQSISVLAYLYQYCRTKGPFLVVAPLTTLGHWRREIETWTDMYCVVFTGSAADRDVIKECEIRYPGDSRGKHGFKYDVLLTSYETILREKAFMRGLEFQVAVLDEAHRLKGVNSQQRAALCDIPIKWKLLLTGTPIQNNMRELFGMMSLLDPYEYNDVDAFLEQYGDESPTVEQVKELQAALAPVLLRRMKEDVETLPEKEEVVIWVELTAEQRMFYKALYSQQIGALLAGNRGNNLPQMRNLAMELRKLCCHPYLCNGLEEDMTARKAAITGTISERELLIKASGKMVLLDKLLPKLRAEGKKVLIFSQFKIMLNVLEDYMTLSGYPCERIDGSVAQRDRQAAIDRFSKVKEPSPQPAAGSGDAEGGASGSGHGSPAGAVQVDEDSFVFLLSTRAGGQGITLTAADTVILYDSDWNPQNDLQAMARCHRIGQVSDVTVYRLVSKDTYEQRLFEVASRKYGLDEAVLGFSAGGDPETDAKRITELLAHGAHALMGADDTADGAAQDGFAAEDIDQILTARTEKRQIGSRKGNTFSTAHFAAEEDAPVPPPAPAPGAAGAREYWTAVLPDAVQAHDEAQRAALMPEVLGPRRRKQVNYNIQDAYTPAKKRRSSDGDGDDSSDDYMEPGQAPPAAVAEKKKRGPKVKEAPREDIDPQLGRVVKPWSRIDADAVERLLMRLGEGRPQRILEKIHLPGRQVDEVEQLTDSIVRILHLAAEMEANGTLNPIKTLTTSIEQLLEQGAGAAEGAAGADGVAAAAASGQAGTSPAEQDGAAATEPTGKQQQRHAESSALLTAVQALSPPLPAPVQRALCGRELLKKLASKPAQQLEALAEHARVHAMAQSEDGLPFRKITWSKRMPSWWGPVLDRALMEGCYSHGFSYNTNILKLCIDDVLCDPSLPFAAKMAPDTEFGADDADFQVPAPAAAAGGSGDAAGHAMASPVVAAAAAAGGDEQAVAMAGVAAAAAGGGADHEAAAGVGSKKPRLLPPKEWERFKKDVATRAKAVRRAALDATYQPPEPTYLGKRIMAPVAPATAAAAATEGSEQPKRARLSDERQDGAELDDGDDFMQGAAGGVGGSSGAGGSGSGSKRQSPDGAAGAGGDGSGAAKKPRSASKPSVGANRKALLAGRLGGKGGMDAFVVKRPDAVSAGKGAAGLASQARDGMRGKATPTRAAGAAARAGDEVGVVDLTAGSPGKGKGAAAAHAPLPQQPQQQRAPGSSSKEQLQQLLGAAGTSATAQGQAQQQEQVFHSSAAHKPAPTASDRSPLTALQHNTSGSSDASQQAGSSADGTKPAAVKQSSAGAAGAAKGGVRKAVDGRKMVQAKLSWNKPKPAEGA